MPTGLGLYNRRYKEVYIQAKARTNILHLAKPKPEEVMLPPQCGNTITHLGFDSRCE